MKNEYIEINIEDDKFEKHVSKKNITDFFKSLSIMPKIDKEKVCQDILNNQLNLPKFKAQTYFLDFFKYGEKEKEIIVIQDFGSDRYYYIQNNQVFKTNRYEASEYFYKEIATITKQDYEKVHDTLIDKLNTYESIFLAKYSKHLSTLDEFIEDNIYMFDAALKEKSTKKHKIK